MTADQQVVRILVDTHGWTVTHVAQLCFELTKPFPNGVAVIFLEFERNGAIRAASAHDGFSPPTDKLAWVIHTLGRKKY